MAYTNIDDPSAFFQIATWSGNASTQSITNDGNSDLKPDWAWTKDGIGYGHKLMDSSRGLGSSGKFLITNSTAAESAIDDYMMTFDTDGFSVGAGDAGFNASNDTYVTWQWKAGGGTTSTNTDGSINTTVQSNSIAGFNIITYTGTGGGETLGHNLGVAPDMWIVKKRDGTGSWAVGFNDSSILGGTSNYLILQGTGATSTYNNFWGSSPANSNVMRIAGDSTIGGSGSTYVAYVFAQKQGYSKFGKYVGNGNADGTFVYTGFQPAFVIIRCSSTTGQWLMFDNKRDIANGDMDYFLANSAAAESNAGLGNSAPIDFLSNGFKLRNTDAWANGSNTYIYMAFAEHPFVTSTGIPTTAR